MKSCKLFITLHLIALCELEIELPRLECAGVSARERNEQAQPFVRELENRRHPTTGSCRSCRGVGSVAGTGRRCLRLSCSGQLRICWCVAAWCTPVVPVRVNPLRARWRSRSATCAACPRIFLNSILSQSRWRCQGAGMFVRPRHCLLPTLCCPRRMMMRRCASASSWDRTGMYTARLCSMAPARMRTRLCCARFDSGGIGQRFVTAFLQIPKLAYVSSSTKLEILLQCLRWGCRDRRARVFSMHDPFARFRSGREHS